jgi:hypothetical protein
VSPATGTTHEGEAAFIDLLAGANDPEHDALTATIKTAPQHGTLQPSGNKCQWLYTPFSSYKGPDSFVYVISDGQGATSATATANLNVR